VHASRARLAGQIIAAATATLLLAATTAAADVRPRLGSPAAGRAFAVGAQPTFTASDNGDAFNGSLWLTIATSRRVDRYGQLKQYRDGGVFTGMRRKRGHRYAYTPPRFSFPGWFLVTPGTYYWQAYHINCSIPNSSRTSCHVYSRIRSFKVR
jgi:hypothetical protein